MRIQIISDLHFEFHRDGGTQFIRDLPITGDTIVIAGDLLPLVDRRTVANTFERFCALYKHVVFVPGNHEYYGTSPANAEAILAACAWDLPSLHILNPGVIEIDDVRFVGAPLWFPETPDEAKYRFLLNDFNQIINFVPWVHETHAAHLTFLKTNVKPGDVVVTHSMPHSGSVASEYVGSVLNRFFLAEDAEPIVEHAGAEVWIHGHTHIPCEYTVNGTYVICNPHGYPGETKFNAGCTINVGKSDIK